MFTRYLIALVLFFLAAPVLLADGLIIIHNPPAALPDHFRFAPLEVKYHRVTVDIDENVATTSIEQAFINPSNQRLEGTYIFPLPEGAHLSKFAMDIAGQMQEAELLDADKARKIYEEIVRQQRDPALLEYVGRGAFKVRIFPIEPHSTKEIRIRYSQLLNAEGGLSEYVYPLNTEKFSSKPLGDVSVRVNVKTSRPLKTVYCPSHTATIRREGERSATVAYEEHNARPDRDFRLVFSQDKSNVDLRLLTHRNAGSEDGYFMLMASPGLAADQPLQARDFCFVVDTSGSMAGEKIKQVRRALRFCIDNLNPADRFQVVRFSTEAQSLWNELRPASEENRKQAITFVESFKPIGGTAIQDALRTALDCRASAPRPGDDGPANPFVIVFLTDGQPTVGETNEDRLVDLATKGTATRIFTFGIGEEINTHLLDRIAEKTNAFTTYVGSKEDLELKLSGFFTGIQSPVLTDVRISFSPEVRVMDLIPRTAPDLFRGQTLYLFGRFTGSGNGAVTLMGDLNGKSIRLAEDIQWPKVSPGNDYIPQLWATRRVGWLLDEIRLRGESSELRDEVTQLARQFGIVTPYTAYLILEDERRRNVPVAMQTMRELGADSLARRKAEETYLSANAKSPRAERSGVRGVENARAMQEMKEAAGGGMAGAPMAADLAKQMPASSVNSQGYRQATNYAQQARMLNGRAFYQNGTVWTDASAQNAKGVRQQRIAFGSDEYFALMREDRNLAAWLSLGTEVDLLHNGVLYQVRN